MSAPVASEWEEVRLGSLLTRKSSRNRPDLPLLSVVRERGVIVRDVGSKKENHNFIPDDLSGYRVVARGDLVINKMKAWSGSLGVAPCDGLVSPAYFVFSLLIDNERYAHYLLRNRTVVDEFARCSGGVRSGQWDLSLPAMKSIMVRTPDSDTQRVIVRYLDHAELRIAKAIASKQGLVRLLNERRSAIEAELLLGVPDASSGSWFGRLPDGWTRLPARAICSERIHRGGENLDLLSVTIRRGVIPQREYFSTDGSKKDQSRSDKAQYKVVKPGDVVYNKMRAWQGAAGCSTFEGIVSPAYVVIRTNQLADPHFLGRVMRTPQFAKEAERWSYGINSDMWSLRPQHFKLIEFAVPPLAVQEDLVRRCVERTETLEAALEAVESEIVLLKEYRTRLISDVVTGKIDVREEAAKLPDIDPAELAAVLAGGAAGADEEEVADGDD